MKIRNLLRNNSDWITPLFIWASGFIVIVLAMMQYESRSLMESIYYGFVTATTVGFGDICPTTPETRIATIIYMLTAIVALGAFLNAFIERSKLLTEKKRNGKMQSKIDPDVIIIGYPTEEKVKSIAKELIKLWNGCSITCITNQIEKKPEWMTQYNVEFIQGRASRLEVLKRANVDKADSILILANDPTDNSSDEYTSSAVMMCETMNPSAHTIAEKVREDDDLFQWANCDKIVSVCRASELVQEVLNIGAIDLIDEIFNPDTEVNHKNLVYVGLSDSWYNMSMEFMRNGTIALGYSDDDGKTFTFAPDPQDMITKGFIIKVIKR